MRKYELNNGVDGIFYDILGSQVFTISFAFIFRRTILPQGKEQVAHLLEHLVSDKIRHFREIGSIQNATTTKNKIEFFITLPNRYFKQVLTEMLSSFSCLDIDRRIFLREKNAITAEIKSRYIRPERKLYNKITEDFLGVSADLDEILESIERISLDDVENFQKEFFKPENMKFFIAGDPELFKVDIKKQIGSFHQETTSGNDHMILTLRRDVDADKLKKNVEIGVVKNSDEARFVYMIILPRKLSSRELFANNILWNLLNYNSRDSFFNEFRKRKLAYSLSYFISQTFLQDYPYYEISGSAKKENIKKIVELFREKLQNFEQNSENISRKISEQKTALKNSRTIGLQTSQQAVQQYSGKYYINNQTEDLSEIDELTAEDVIDYIHLLLSNEVKLLYIIKAE